MNEETPLWIPSEETIRSAPLTAFMRAASEKHGLELNGYDALHQWSLDDREGFWKLVWDFCGVIGEQGTRIMTDGERMPGAAFFPDARLNFAENLLRRTGRHDGARSAFLRAAERSRSIPEQRYLNRLAAEGD